MNADALRKIVLPQIEELLKEFDALETSERDPDGPGIEVPEASAFITAGQHAIHRTVGPTDPLAQQIDSVIKLCSPWHIREAVPHVVGALRTLKVEIESGYLATIQELIHASVFSDFLEMAGHLLDEGYKDPAAVLIGGVLEGHLRKLCDKSSIATDYTTSSGDLRPKKADLMNADLAKAGVYSKLDQKSIIAWLDLRNKAAHGQYADYSQQQVQLLLQSVMDFLARYPA